MALEDEGFLDTEVPNGYFKVPLPPKVASLHLACAIVCCPIGGLLSNRIGRRKCFIYISIPCLLGWALIAVGWNREAIFAGKFLTAFGSTLLSSSIGVYISETVHPSLRGSLAVFQSLFLSLGMLIVFGIGYFVDWRTLAWLCAVPGALLFIMFVFLPESPYWLVQNGYNEAAKKALQFLRGEDFDIKEELNEMIKRKESNEASMASSSNTWTWTFKRLASRAYLKPFFCIGFIKIFMTWGGMNILMMYMVNVFRGSKSSIDPELAPVFVGIVRVFSSVCSSYLMRTASRKILFIVCMSIIAFGNLIIATYSILKTKQEENPDTELSFLDSLGWLPLAVIIVILISHALGCLPVVHVLTGELYPTDVRPLCVGITHSISSMFSVANVKTYPYQLDTLQFYGTFYLYAAANFSAMLWGLFTIPDNRGLSLVKVETNYENSKGEEERNKASNEEQSVALFNEVTPNKT